MNMPSRETVNQLRSRYPVGTRIKLTGIDDARTPPVGTLGTAHGVDDMGSIMVHWDNGSTLSLVYGVDSCEKI